MARPVIWVIDWSAWQAADERLAALRATVADEQLAAAQLRARIHVAMLLLDKTARAGSHQTRATEKENP